MQRRKVAKKKRSNTRTSKESSNGSNLCMETSQQYTRVEASELSSARLPRSSSPLKNIEVFQKEFPTRIVDLLAKQATLAIDCETGGLDPRLHRLLTVQIGTVDGDVFVLQKPVSILGILNPHKTLIFHHAAFDLRFLHHQLDLNYHTCGKVICTKMLSKFVYPGERSGLGKVIERVLKIEINKQINHKEWSHDNLTKRQLEYIANDVIYLHDLVKGMWKLLGVKNEQVFLRAMQARVAMLEIEDKGYTDLFKYEDDLIQKIEEKR